jgi:hypothetical protein
MRIFLKRKTKGKMCFIISFFIPIVCRESSEKRIAQSIIERASSTLKDALIRKGLIRSLFLGNINTTLVKLLKAVTIKH